MCRLTLQRLICEFHDFRVSHIRCDHVWPAFACDSAGVGLGHLGERDERDAALEKLHSFLHMVFEIGVLREVLVVVRETSSVLALLLPQGLSEGP